MIHQAHEIRQGLEHAGARRAQLRIELENAEDYLRGLVSEGRREGLSVSEMCRLSGVSRETAHKWLRRNGDTMDIESELDKLKVAGSVNAWHRDGDVFVIRHFGSISRLTETETIQMISTEKWLREA